MRYSNCCKAAVEYLYWDNLGRGVCTQVLWCRKGYNMFEQSAFLRRALFCSAIVLLVYYYYHIPIAHSFDYLTLLCLRVNINTGLEILTILKHIQHLVIPLYKLSWCDNVQNMELW